MLVINLYSINLESEVESEADALSLSSPNTHARDRFFLKQSESRT